jgi:RHS repeat-associated protein
MTKKIGVLLTTLFVLFMEPAFCSGELAATGGITNIFEGAYFDVIDGVYLYADQKATVTHTIDVKDVISFKLRNEGTYNYYNANLRCKIKIRIEKWGWNDVNPQQEEVDLEVEYLVNGSSKTEAHYKFENAHKLRITVLDIPAEFEQNMPPVFTLGGEIYVDRKFQFNPDLTNGIKLINVAPDLDTRKATISWEPKEFPGAEEFDLEWTFVDKESAFGTTLTNFTPAEIQSGSYDESVHRYMRFNNTRITIPNNGSPTLGHTVNLTAAEGFLLFRVRAVQYHHPSGNRIESKWAYKWTDGTELRKFFVNISSGHEDKFNWQTSISYAEEGKSKEIVSYFDGLLKSRQTITLSNTSPVAIAQENVFDQYGRPALSVIPAPINVFDLKFQPLLNQKVSGGAYSYKELSVNIYGRLVAAPMGTQNGASAYYSPSNPFLDPHDAGNNQIPNAEKFPFSVTQFTNDQTGRIKAQGGVGIDFQVDGEHATRYFYSKPSQSELYRMFGKEVGNHQHYLKNMVVDPNRQVSISYVNSSGKTIATSLAGDGEANLDKLASWAAPEAVRTLDDELMSPGSYIVDRDKFVIRFSTSFLAAMPGTYTLNCVVSPEKLETLHGSDGHLKICNDCYYTARMVVTDDNGNIKRAEELGTLTTNYNTDCNEPANGLTGGVTLTDLEMGKYNVEYEIIADKAALNAYWEDQKINNTDIRKLDDFKREYIHNTDYTGCFTDCKSCKETLGEYTSFETAVKDAFAKASISFSTDDGVWAQGLYNNLLANCNALPCPEESPCQVYLDRILDDVTPGGQYALYNEETMTLIEPEINVIGKRSNHIFLDENGQPDLVTVENGQELTPAQLSNEQFIKYFKPSWANELAKLHPEYCYYLYCDQKNTGGERYSRKIENVTKAEEAITEGWFSATNDHYYELLLDADDFYKTGNPGATFREEVRNRFNNYFIDQNTFTGKSVKQFVDQLLYCTQGNNDYPNCPSPSPECRNLDLEWNMFRNVYLSVKQSYADKARKQTPGFENCSNCYIGTETRTFAGQPAIGIPSTFQSTNEYVPHNISSTPTTDCDGLSVTGSVWISASDYAMIEFTISSLSDKYVSFYATLLGREVGKSAKVVIGSKLVKYSPYYAPGYEFFDFSFSNVAYEDFEVKISGLNCNSCSDGYYKLNGKDVYVSSGNEQPPTGYGNFSFQSNLTVQSLTGTSCSFKNVSVSTKIDDLTACPGLNDVTVFKEFEHREEVPPTRDIFICTHGYKVTLDKAYALPLKIDVQYVYDGNEHGLESVHFNPGELSKTFVIEYETDGGCGSNILSSNIICTPVLSCPPVPYSNLFSTKKKVFSSVKDFKVPMGDGTYSGMEQAVTEVPYTTSYQSCEGRVEWILAKLMKGCTVLTSNPEKIDQLKTALVELCQGGLIPPDWHWAYDENLKQTIENILGTSALNNNCNDLILDNLKQYGKDPIKPAWVYSLGDISTCVLDHIQRWNNEFIANPAGYANLRDYIRGVGNMPPYFITNGQEYKIGSVFNMSQEDLTVLLNALNNGCNFLTKSILIPPYLQCNQLLSFPEYEASKTEFETAYPYVQATDNNYWELLATFLNRKYGTDFSKSDVKTYAQSGSVDQYMLGYDFADAYPQQPDLYKCLKEQIEFANTRAINDYNIYIEEQRLAFYKRYTDKCLGISPSLRLVAKIKEYHYTLYYYDQSSNLVKTVPPAGVRLLNETQINQLLADPVADILPDHVMSTVYKYNSLNQVVWQKSPDGSSSRFWYDELGRLVASQNDVQLPKQAFSYTSYDALGRIIEVGEKTNATVSLGSSTGSLQDGRAAVANLQVSCCHVTTRDEYSANSSITFEPGFDSDPDDYFETYILNGTDDRKETLDEFFANGANDQITRTQYDEKDERLSPDAVVVQSNLRKRVAAMSYWEKDANGQLIPMAASHYSYDVAGNVNKLWQESKAMADIDISHRYKTIQYNFDLVSGKVNKVSYQKDQTDAFFYQYNYDAENRIIGAYSSTDNIIWKRDADYRYYLHGPLKRTELGDNKTSAIVQGIDYTYTLQGWLKSINGKQLGHANDPGNDADPANPDRKYIPEDVIGYSINYHNNDFHSIATSPINNNKYQSTDLSATGAELFNGNIRATSYVNKVLQNGVAVGYSYRYDQLNRLMKMRRHDIANDGSDWGNSTIVSGYREDLSYDANGNIQTLNRFGSSGMINEMSYVYKTTNNQLLNVNDTYSPQTHYTYDAIGNLIQEGDQTINWTLYGKIKNIVKPGNTIAYQYDPSGNRITKTVGQESTHYIRDAQGNVIAAYEANNGSGLKLTEQHLYGSSRLGLFKRGLEVQSTGVNTYIGHDSYISGNKFFELNNHLGNVLATISDKKIGVASDNDPLLVDHYKADIKTGQDYYPFGMLLTDWAEKAKDYRYGFNGKENDNEVKGTGNQIDFGSRALDVRLGRWFSPDPLYKKYPSYSSYSYCTNNPVYLKDVDGKDVYVFDKDKNIVAVIRTDYKDIAIQINYRSNQEIRTPIIQKTDAIWYSGHKSYEDAIVIGISYSKGGKMSVVGGTEIVLFTRGPDAGKPQVYAYGGVSTGVSKGSNVGLSVAALNLYKPYGMKDDMLDKRVRAADKDVTKESYQGPFFSTQLGIHNTIYGTDNTWPAPFGKINWFGEGVTLTSLAVSASGTSYRLLGSLETTDKGSVVPIDKSLQEKIDQFNKEHPKENDTNKVTQPATTPAPQKQ